MEAILENVDWIAVIVAWAAAFVLGSLWFSPVMFVKPWMRGLGTMAAAGRPMFIPLGTQLVGTFLLAWALAIALGHSLALAILISLAVSALIKANGLFAGKGTSSVAVETGFALAQSVVIIVILQLF